MRLKLFRADRMADAMARIRAELGPDALILSTRRLGSGVEITAALEETEPDTVLPLIPGGENTHPPVIPAKAGIHQAHRAGESNSWPVGITLSPGPPGDVPVAQLQRSARVAQDVDAGLAIRFAQSPDLTEALARRLTFQPLPSGPPVLLVGPPGAGKTLTAARLATRHVLTGTTPTVITADGKRAGAAEQLAAYTRLLNLNLLIAPDAVTLARALSRPATSGPILIDCPGTNPYRPEDQTEIRALASTSQATIALVLPAGLCPEESADLAQAYSQVGATHLIATRLDLTSRLSGILAAADVAQLALAEAGVGPGAADGLIPLTPQLLASRLSAKGRTPNGQDR